MARAWALAYHAKSSPIMVRLFKDEAVLEVWKQRDTGRYALLVGLSPDLYLRQGVFVSPRMLLSVPLLAPASGTALQWWAEGGLVVGVAL